MNKSTFTAQNLVYSSPSGTPRTLAETLASFTMAKQVQNSGDKCEYFNYEHVLQRGKDLSDQGAPMRSDVRLRCYYNLRWWVCPNPNDQHRSESLQHQYRQGRYVEQRTLDMSTEMYNDDELCNSKSG